MRAGKTIDPEGPTAPPEDLSADQKALWQIGELLRETSAGNLSVRAKVLTIVHTRLYEARQEPLAQEAVDRAVNAANEATAAGLGPHEQLIHGIKAYLGLDPNGGGS